MADYGRITIKDGKNYFYDDKTKQFGQEVKLKMGDTGLDRNGKRNMWDGSKWVPTFEFSNKRNGSYIYNGQFWRDKEGMRLADDNVIKLGNGNYKRLNPDGTETYLMRNGQFTEQGNALADHFKENMLQGNVYDVRISDVNGKKFSKARTIRQDQGKSDLANEIHIGWRNDTDFDTNQRSINNDSKEVLANRKEAIDAAESYKPQTTWLQKAKANTAKRDEEVIKSEQFKDFVKNEQSKDSREGTGYYVMNHPETEYTPYDWNTREQFGEATITAPNRRSQAIQKYIDTHSKEDLEKVQRGLATIEASKSLQKGANNLALAGTVGMAAFGAAPIALEGLFHPVVTNVLNKTIWQPVKFLGEGMLTNPLSTAGYMTASTAADYGLEKVGEHYGVQDNDLFKAGKFAASTAIGGFGDLLGNTSAALIRKGITNRFTPFIQKHALAEKAEDLLLNTYGTSVEKGVAKALKNNWRTAAINTAVGTGIGAGTEQLSDLSDNKIWKNAVTYYAPYILAKRLNTQTIKQAELASNGADNAATGATNVLKTLQSKLANPVLKAKIKLMSRDSDKEKLINKYLEAGNKSIRTQLKEKYPKFFTDDVVETLNAYKLLTDEYGKKFTALYPSFQKEGARNAWGGGSTVRALSTFLNKSGYTTLQFNRVKQDDAHTFIGTAIDGRHYKADSPNRVLSEIAASSGTKNQGKVDVYSYTQDKEINDKFASELSDLYVIIKGKDGKVIRKPILKEDGTIDKQALSEASFAQRQQDPKVGITDAEGTPIRENWDGYRKILVGRKGEDGKDNIAYTIGIDVAGGATMQSHGNSGHLASTLNSFHPHNITEIKIWEGIPHNNLFDLSTTALTSKVEVKNKQPTEKVWDKIFNYLPNRFIDRANKNNYINARDHAQEFVSSKINDLERRRNLAEFYNSVFGEGTFTVPKFDTSIRGVKINGDKLDKSYWKQYRRAVENIENQIDSEYKSIYEDQPINSVKSSKKSSKKKERKQKITEQDIIRFQNLISDIPQSVYEKYHKQGGKLEQIKQLKQGGPINNNPKTWEEYQKQNRNGQRKNLEKH